MLYVIYIRKIIMLYVIYIRIKETPIVLQFQACAINIGFEEYHSNSSVS